MGVDLAEQVKCKNISGMLRQRRSTKVDKLYSTNLIHLPPFLLPNLPPDLQTRVVHGREMLTFSRLSLVIKKQNARGPTTTKSLMTNETRLGLLRWQSIVSCGGFQYWCSPEALHSSHKSSRRSRSRLRYKAARSACRPR